MTRAYFVIWGSALAIAAAFIALVIMTYDETEQQYPKGLPELQDARIVFIGSSLTAFALPRKEAARGVLGDGRSCAMLSVPGISEALSTRLLAHAIDSGAETVFLEINAYAHEYLDVAEPAIAHFIVNGMREAGSRLATSVKSLFRPVPRPNYVIKCRAGNADRTLDAAQLFPRDYYRFRFIEPGYGDELKDLLAQAREKNIEILFFSPPRPRSLVQRLENGEFAAFLAHLDHIAAAYDLPLWRAPAAWPDDHFMDILAHANERGRARFRHELTQWYETRP